MISVQHGGQVHQRIETAKKLVDRIDRSICGGDSCEIVAKGDGYGTVEIGTDMHGFVGDFESVDAGVFDNVIILAVMDDLHVAIRKVSRAPADVYRYMARNHTFQGGK